MVLAVGVEGILVRDGLALAAQLGYEVALVLQHVLPRDATIQIQHRVVCLGTCAHTNPEVKAYLALLSRSKRECLQNFEILIGVIWPLPCTHAASPPPVGCKQPKNARLGRLT